MEYYTREDAERAIKYAEEIIGYVRNKIFSGSALRKC